MIKKGAWRIAKPKQILFFDFHRRNFGLCPGREALHTFNTKSAKPLEGQGPNRACKCNDQEISYRASDILVSEESGKRRAEAGFNSKNAENSERELDYLCIPASLGLKVNNLRIKEINKHQTCGTAKECAGIFHTALEVVGIESAVARNSKNVCKEAEIVGFKLKQQLQLAFQI